jgi:hypothetical protein
MLWQKGVACENNPFTTPGSKHYFFLTLFVNQQRVIPDQQLNVTVNTSYPDLQPQVTIIPQERQKKAIILFLRYKKVKEKKSIISVG